MSEGNERRTTISLYWADLMWLQERQRAVSFERNRLVTMPDLIRELIQAVRQAEDRADDPR